MSKTRAAPRKGHKTRLEQREELHGYLFVAPWAIGFVAFVAGPMAVSLLLSATKYNPFKTPEFIGLGNYATFIGDGQAWASLFRTGYFAALFVPPAIAGAYLLAAFLNRQRLPGSGLFRSAFFMPSLLPHAAVAVIWAWLLNPQLGFINEVLGVFGIPGPGWLSSSTWAIPGLALVSVWAAIGGNAMLIFLAALQNVSSDLQDAAKVDGAGQWLQFRHVTFPAISPAVFFNVVLAVIAAFKVFTLAFIATNGGPAYATTFFSLYLYQQGFENFDLGYAAALGWVMLLIVLVFTWLQFRSSKSWVHYEGELR